jgi:DNA-binding NarL/FixJ family response regulator
LLEVRLDLQIICLLSDGWEAVQKAKELKPDLILLDIGLPKLNGIEVARQIRHLSPACKIIFLSQDSSLEVVQEALRAGGQGYVQKAHAGSDLLPAIDSVLRGSQFVSNSIKGFHLLDTSRGNTPHRHEVLFYSDEAVFLESFTQSIAAALKAGDVAIANITNSHRDSLIQRLKAEGVDVHRAIQEGRFVTLDAVETFSKTMVDGLLDSARFLDLTNGLIEAASKTVKVGRSRIVLCGEGVGLLWAEGKTDAAMRIEQLCNVLAESHDVTILCAYPLSSFLGKEDGYQFQDICAEHSAVCPH